MNKPSERLESIHHRIKKACATAERLPSAIKLLVVSKRQSAEKIQVFNQLGVHSFGENQLQEAIGKQDKLEHLELEWHFIGAIQSNKTRAIAEHFQWVQSVDRERILRRLDSQRPPQAGPLNICLQVNIDNEPQKGGVRAEDVLDLAAITSTMKNVKLRGLMVIPKFSKEVSQQRDSFRRVRELFEQLKKAGYDVDTLSMGMSSDLEAAIFEGSTMVRVGTDLFGARGA